MVADEKWVLPSSIPFDNLKGYDLEECIYWLMDSLGAKDLEWRVGGAGGGAADGGRDLEARFYSPSPDGNMEAERWWIECKGRSVTVEPDAVKSACTNALAQGDLDYLVIATNSTFSNPTRDWLKMWQAKFPRPKVKLWDKSSLERMLSRHPNAVFRLFSQSLSVAGQLEVAREAFWNRFDYTAPKNLKSFWVARADLAIGPLERIALVVSEFAHGRIGDRPWGVGGGPRASAETLGLAVANFPYLFGRAVRSEIEQQPLIRAMAYLVLSALTFFSAETIAELIEDQLKTSEDQPMPSDLKRFLLSPVLNTLVFELQEVCTADCPRFLAGRGDAMAFDNEPAGGYWQRLRPEGRADVAESDQPQLWLQKNDVPCKVGFAVDQHHGCPLFEGDVDEDRLVELLAIVERIADFRVREEAEAN